MFMAVYFTWGMMTTMSSRVYLNLVLAAHGGEGDGVTTGGLSSSHARPANHTEGTDKRPEYILTFGAKFINRRIAPATFAMVSLYLFAFLGSPITSHRYASL
jgi:hypothetical protein